MLTGVKVSNEYHFYFKMCESSELDVKLKTITINFEFLTKRFKNPDLSDVTLIVEGKEFPAVRNILAMQSTFFDVLFTGNFEDGNKDKLELKEVKVRPFEILLQYMYSGDIELKSIELEIFLELVELAHFFGMPAVLQKLNDHAAEIKIAEDNVVDIINVAALFKLEKLLEFSIDYIFENQETFIEKKMFLTCNETALYKLLDIDSWNINECEYILLIADWLESNPTTKRQELLSRTILRNVETVDLITHIRPKQLFTDDKIFDAILEKEKKPNHTITVVVTYLRTVENKNSVQKSHLYAISYTKIKSIFINIETVDYIYIHFSTNGPRHKMDYCNNGYLFIPSSVKNFCRFYISCPHSKAIDVSRIIVKPWLCSD